MSLKLESTDRVLLCSIKDLVSKRLENSKEWELAIVQRDELWDDIRMANLLDTLLAGWPVGTLLLCQVKQSTSTINPSGRARKINIAEEGSWQLLDGQQRINALATIFNLRSNFGRFLMDLTIKPNRDDVVTKRNAKRRKLKYLKFVDAGDNSDEFDNRNTFIDLSGWYNWIIKNNVDELLNLTAQRSTHHTAFKQAVMTLDGKFGRDLEPKQLDIAMLNFNNLLHTWKNAIIPAQKITLDNASDVLHVFSRINLEGVDVCVEDIFFAGIKTIWSRADESLVRVIKCVPVIIERMSALRVLARLSNMYLKGDDLLPLRIDRLAKDKGVDLKNTIEWLSGENHPALKRMTLVAKWLTEKSKIGNGLREIDSRLFDHVFAWAAVNPNLDDEPKFSKWLPPIENYLVGAQTYGWATKLRDRYSRLAFKISVVEGSRGQLFPWESIVDHRFYDLAPANGEPINDDDDWQDLVRNNYRLFLSIVQQLPWELNYGNNSCHKIEWDHIFPISLSKHMKVSNNNRKKYHEDKKYVDYSGNKWALEGKLNRLASDKWPSEKLRLLEKETGTGDVPNRWPAKDQEFMTRKERFDLISAERYFRFSIRTRASNERDNYVNLGMSKFKEFVDARRLRLYREVLKSFEHLPRFAGINPDANVAQIPDIESLSIFSYGPWLPSHRSD